VARNRGRNRILVAAHEGLLPAGRDPFWVRRADLPVLVPVPFLVLGFFPPLVAALLGSGIEVWPLLPVGNGGYPRTLGGRFSGRGSLPGSPVPFWFYTGSWPLGVIHTPVQPCHQLLRIAVLDLQLL
jgi:hypothetical protein